LLKTNSSKDGFRPMGPWLMSRTKTEGNEVFMVHFPDVGCSWGRAIRRSNKYRTGDQPFRSSGSSAGKAILGYSTL